MHPEADVRLERGSFQRISVEVDGETSFRSGFFGYPTPKRVADSVGAPDAVR